MSLLWSSLYKIFVAHIYPNLPFQSLKGVYSVAPGCQPAEGAVLLQVWHKTNSEASNRHLALNALGVFGLKLREGCMD